jgi:hypothetical protein
MEKTPSTVPELVDAFGGATGFAKVIGKAPSTASEQKRSRSIPVEYWDLVIAGARSAGIPGVTYEALARMHIPAERRVDFAEART